MSQDLLVKEISEQLGISRSTVYKMLKRQVFPHAYKTGRIWRIPSSDIDMYCSSTASESEPEPAPGHEIEREGEKTAPALESDAEAKRINLTFTHLLYGAVRTCLVIQNMDNPELMKLLARMTLAAIAKEVDISAVKRPDIARVIAHLTRRHREIEENQLWEMAIKIASRLKYYDEESENAEDNELREG